MLRYKMLKTIISGVSMLRYVPFSSIQGGQHVPEWQAIQTNQSTLLFRILPDFRGSTSSGLSILGNKSNLNFESQTVIAKWLVMTCIIAEFTNPERRGISKNDINSFYLAREVPNFWKIWIGKYDGDKSPIRAQRAINFYNNKEEMKENLLRDLAKDQLQGHSMSLALGNLFLFAVNTPEEFSERINMKPFDRKLEQLWPISNPLIYWPSRQGIDTKELYQIANYYSHS